MALIFLSTVIVNVLLRSEFIGKEDELAFFGLQIFIGERSPNGAKGKD